MVGETPSKERDCPDGSFFLFFTLRWQVCKICNSASKACNFFPPIRSIFVLSNRNNMDSATQISNARVLPGLVGSNQKTKMIRAEARRQNARQLVLFYDNEFRIWHYKLLMIIILTIAGLYGAVYTIATIMN
jgi:hypothetical protein